MYIRAKHQQGRTYYAVVRAEREGGKVRQRLVTYLGKHSSLESAISEIEAHIHKAHLCLEQSKTLFNSPERAVNEERNLKRLTRRLITLCTIQEEMQKSRPTTKV